MENPSTSPATWEDISFLTSDDRIVYRIQEAGKCRLVCQEVFTSEDAALIAKSPEMLADGQALYDAIQHHLMGVSEGIWKLKQSG
jgi:hypothetical protein